MIAEYIYLTNDELLSKEERAMMKYLREKRVHITRYGLLGEYLMESGISSIDKNIFKKNLSKRYKIKDDYIKDEIERLIFKNLWQIEVIKVYKSDYESFYDFFESIYQEYKNNEKEFEGRLKIYKVEVEFEDEDEI